MGRFSPAEPRGGGCGPAGLPSTPEQRDGDPRGGEQQLCVCVFVCVETRCCLYTMLGAEVTPRTSCPCHWDRSQRALKVTARLCAPRRPKQTWGQPPACPAGCPGDTAWPPTGLQPPRSSDLQGRTSPAGREVEMSCASWIWGSGKCLATEAAGPQRESRAQRLI